MAGRREKKAGRKEIRKEEREGKRKGRELVSQRTGLDH